MIGWSRIFRVSLISILLVISATACQFDLGLSEMDLPFFPTETSPPDPTATTIPTPTVPPKTGGTGDSYQITVRDDDFTVFTDRELGFQLVLPPEWLVIPVDETLREELVAEAAANLRESLSRLLENSTAENGVRMIAYDYTEKFKYLEENFLSNINIVFDGTVSPELDLEAILEASVTSFEELFEESDVIYQSIEENANGITYATMIVSHPVGVFGVPLRQVLFIVQLDSGMVVITASVHEETYTDAERSFKSVINSFELVD